MLWGNVFPSTMSVECCSGSAFCRICSRKSTVPCTEIVPNQTKQMSPIASSAAAVLKLERYTKLNRKHKRRLLGGVPNQRNILIVLWQKKGDSATEEQNQDEQREKKQKKTFDTFCSSLLAVF